MPLFEQPAWVTERREEIERIIGQYPDRRSALMPLLHLAQEVRGYVADEDIAAVADLLGLTQAYVESVCSFYSMYHRHPVGKYHIVFCNNCSCALMGGERLREYLKQKLGIESGQTTPDGLISLEITHECLAACDAGPVLQVNGEYVIRLTEEKIDALIEDLRSGKGPEAHIEKRLLTGHFWDADPNDLPKVPPEIAAAEAAAVPAEGTSAPAAEAATAPAEGARAVEAPAAPAGPEAPQESPGAGKEGGDQ
ncbi:MAG: NAD(P)H-dependent oxidoreductase subunit E [Firmicutes bacterium]|nr:NAD(P)H-dependent oxidoreductase subunit E [Bacillota bacterium]